MIVLAEKVTNSTDNQIGVVGHQNYGDNPPPYQSSSIDPSTTATSSSPPLPDADTLPVSVGDIHIHKRHEGIIGSYCINPPLPRETNTQSSVTPGDRKSKHRGTPNASFRTRRGAIALKLTTGDSGDSGRVTVDVASRRGSIGVEVLAISSLKRLNLEVYSRKGDILVLLPRTFFGGIHIRTRKGGYDILPAFSKHMRVMHGKKSEVFIRVGEKDEEPQNTRSNLWMDYCQLVAGSGRVIVGLSGEDTYQPPTEVNVWKKLAGFLVGA